MLPQRGRDPQIENGCYKAFPQVQTCWGILSSPVAFADGLVLEFREWHACDFPAEWCPSVLTAERLW